MVFKLTDGTPRREIAGLVTPAELAIRYAIDAVAPPSLESFAIMSASH